MFIFFIIDWSENAKLVRLDLWLITETISWKKQLKKYFSLWITFYQMINICGHWILGVWFGGLFMTLKWIFVFNWEQRNIYNFRKKVLLLVSCAKYILIFFLFLFNYSYMCCLILMAWKEENTFPSGPNNNNNFCHLTYQFYLFRRLLEQAPSSREMKCFTMNDAMYCSLLPSSMSW